MKTAKHPLSDLPTFRHDDAPGAAADPGGTLPQGGALAGGAAGGQFGAQGGHRVEVQAGGDALRLIGAVSHEMRNPLNGILGMAHLLAETSLDGAQRSYLEGIRTSGDVLLALVNDLLDLTALQSGAISLCPTPTDIVALIEQCVELAAPRAHAKGLSLGSTLDPLLTYQSGPSHLHLTLDGSRLRQVLTNLLSNAIKFTDEGGVQLCVTLDPQGHALIFDVIDTGVGIAAADHAMVFAPFGRTKSALTAGTEGTGLGLPLSRSLARALGGTLALHQSVPGQGTTMRLCLPLGDEPLPLSSGAQPLAGEQILLALGPAFALSPEANALVSTLQALGAQAHVVSDTAALKDAPVGMDHVLVDAGFDHAMLWARLCLPTSGVRPITLLRPGEREQLSDLQEAGFSGYLIRPVRQSSLVSMLTHRFEQGDAPRFLPDPMDSLAPTDSLPSAPKKVLLADDNPVNALLAQTALEKAGHTVMVVEDGARAIALAGGSKGEKSAFDVVLLDLSMPVLDGFAAARQLRRNGFTGRLIAFSGNTDPSLETKLQAAGFDSFAQKPLPPQALQALIAGT